MVIVPLLYYSLYVLLLVCLLMYVQYNSTNVVCMFCVYCINYHVNKFEARSLFSTSHLKKIK